MTMTNGEFAHHLSETIKRRLFSLPGASRAIAELSEAATVAAFLVLLTENLTNSVDAAEVPQMVSCINRFGARLKELTAALPFAETPPDLEGVMCEAYQALAQHGYVNDPAVKRTVS